MLRAGIHKVPYDIMTIYKFVSIPMLRAGIHLGPDGEPEHGLVSIPMLRAGIHTLTL